MSKDNNEIIAELSYSSGILYANLIMIREDLRMGDLKNALKKLNDSINLMEEKVISNAILV